MDMITFATRLKEVRESKNISAEVLAEVTGLNKTTIHRYEKGAFKSIKQEKLDAIAKFLAVDSDYLIGKNNTKYTINSVITLKENPALEVRDILSIVTELLQNEGLTLDGKPVTKQTIISIIYSIETSLEMAKRIESALEEMKGS